MAAPLDGERLALVQRRTHVVVAHRRLAQRQEDVHHGHGIRRCGNLVRAIRYLAADLAEQRAFELLHPLTGVEHLALVLLQLRRDEPLGVHQRLPPHVVLGHLVQLRVGHLQVVPEHPVVTHLQRGDAGALPLGALQRRDVRPRVL